MLLAIAACPVLAHVAPAKAAAPPVQQPGERSDAGQFGSWRHARQSRSLDTPRARYRAGPDPDRTEEHRSRVGLLAFE